LYRYNSLSVGDGYVGEAVVIEGDLVCPGGIVYVDSPEVQAQGVDAREHGFTIGVHDVAHLVVGIDRLRAAGICERGYTERL